MYKALLVDSLEYNLRSLKALGVWNERSGFYPAASAQNGEEALALLRDGRYDLVLTDINLPVMDGLQLLKRIRREGLCEIVIMLSDTVQFQYIKESVISGAFDYLQKIPDEGNLLEVLARARAQLDAAEQEPSGAHANRTAEPDTQPVCAAFVARDKNAPALFHSVLCDIRAHSREGALHADIAARRLYGEVVAALFAAHPWLSLYQSEDGYRHIDYLSSSDAATAYFTRRITALHALTGRLLPPLPAGSVHDACLYLLANPEGDLRLRAAASKVFLNYTYLSTQFALKMGVRYSDYVQSVRMHRAKFLLQNTDDRVYEIGERLGYSDINYFSRQFKRFWGTPPARYRADAPSDWAFL